MDFENYLKLTAKKLDGELERILKKNLVPATKEFANACRGGKRIRGALVKLGYELEDPPKADDIVKIGAAYEIFHAALLVHDDIMDQSDIRRSKPSLHNKVGIAKAITLADYGFFLAIKIISESNFPQNYKQKALEVFAQVACDTAVGQIMDLEGADKLETAGLKTARYTIAGPLQIGAILTGANSALLHKLDQFGQKLGIAYQLRDDILDGENAGSTLNALKYAKESIKLIPKITTQPKMKKLMRGLAEFIVERKK